jgi:hypothetical protein
LPAAEAAVKILKKEELFMLLKTGTFHVAPTEKGKAVEKNGRR